MSWKPKAVSGSSYGVKGHARVQVNKQKGKMRLQVKVVNKETKDEKIYKFVLDKANVPDAVQKWFDPEIPVPEGPFNVSLNGDEDELWGIYPVNGMFTGKVLRFAAKEGEKPSPKTIDTGKYSFQVFTVLVEITSPNGYAGLIVPFSLSYNFQGIEEEIQGKSYTVVAFSRPKSKYTEQLMEFCEVSGAWEGGPMKFSDNILPGLEKRILGEGKKFQFTLKNGWLETLYDMSGLDFDKSDEPKEEEDNSDNELDDGFDTTPAIVNDDGDWETDVSGDEKVEETTIDDDEIPWEE